MKDTDMQVSFEFYTDKQGCGLNFSKDEDGLYLEKRTRIAFKYFCIGYNCGERG